jgi:hypothetical protein
MATHGNARNAHRAEPLSLTPVKKSGAFQNQAPAHEEDIGNVVQIGSSKWSKKPKPSILDFGDDVRIKTFKRKNILKLILTRIPSAFSFRRTGSRGLSMRFPLLEPAASPSAFVFSRSTANMQHNHS